jgi:hypothetical protein
MAALLTTWFNMRRSPAEGPPRAVSYGQNDNPDEYEAAGQNKITTQNNLQILLAGDI